MPWTIDSGDRVMSDAGNLKDYDVCHRLAYFQDMGGAVVLAHDSDRRNRNTEDFTLSVVCGLLESATVRGIQVLTVSQLLEKAIT